MRRLSRGEHVFATNGTIVLILVFEALVCIKDANRYAHTALIAVPEDFGATDSTKAALIAVEGFLGERHPEITHAAMILSELCIAADTAVPEANGQVRG